MQVLLHDSKEVPMMHERGFVVSPGFLTRVAVTAQYVSIQTIKVKFAHSVIQ